MERRFSVQKTIIQNSRILIVDDQIGNIRLLERILKEAGYRHWVSLTDSREVLTTFSQFRPDLVALDWRMPNVDGLSLLKQLRSLIPEGEFDEREVSRMCELFPEACIQEFRKPRRIRPKYESGTAVGPDAEDELYKLRRFYD